MNDATAAKLEVFLLLALRRGAPADSTERAANAEENDRYEEIFAPLTAQMPAPETEKFERLRAAYERKSGAEKEGWRNRVASGIGDDSTPLDDSIHRSHIDAALLKESAAVRRIVAAGMTTGDENGSGRERENTGGEKSRRRGALDKTVRDTFAAGFVSKRNLPAPTVFDRLSGAQLARLIRLAGVREVALACVRIDAVESVASFLRRFSAGDARAIAAQLAGLPQTSGERLAFAENLVQTALESGLKPAAMLDLLGFRLLGIALCGATPERVRYTEQKLPLEVEPTLSDIIDAECRKTSIPIQREVERQIERLAATAAETGEKIKA